MMLTHAANAAILALVLTTAEAPPGHRGEEVADSVAVHVVVDGTDAGSGQGWLCTLLRKCRT